MYTFQSICVEDKETVMPDGTTKILLSSKGTMDDVAPDMKAFLEYVDGKMVEDAFVQEIDQEIRSIKAQEQERVSYMTYAMKIQEERDEARAEGRVEGRAEGKESERISSIRNLMKNMRLTAQQAMDVLEIPVTEQAKYAALL